MSDAFDINDPEAPHGGRCQRIEARPWRSAHRARFGKLAGADHHRSLWLDLCRSIRLPISAYRSRACCSVSVWDKSMVGAVERAIRDSGLGLNPITDGMTSLFPIRQELNEQRRGNWSRSLQHQYAEQGAYRSCPPCSPRRHGPAEKAGEGQRNRVRK